MNQKYSLENVKKRVNQSKVLLFDFDGTLVNLDKLNVDAFSIVFKNMFNIEFTRDDFMKYISGRGSTNGLVEYLKIHNIENFTPENINTQFYENKKRLIEERIDEEIYLLPGIKEFLEKYSKGRRVIVVTSSREEHVKRMLTHFGIYVYFEKIYDRYTVIRGKPDPEGYLKAVEYTGYEIGECIAFEDSFYGLQSAKGADLFTVGILNPGWNDDFVYQLSDFVINDYRELI